MASVLEQFSEGLAGVVESAGRNLVRVEARRRMPATGVIFSADGVIVTSHHVVERDDNIKVGLPNGETVSAKLVGRDPSTDLAVLKVDASDLNAANWSDPGSLKVGHIVLALGRPGDKPLATLGIVSALDEGWRTSAGGKIDAYLQTDVVMYPGFSGGSLVDVSGNHLGINTSAMSRGTSITIPTPTIRRVAETLLKHGQVRRGYFGVGTQPVRLSSSVAGQIGQEAGLLLVSVEAGSPAETGGLMIGDILTQVNNQPVYQVDALLALLADDLIGQSIPVKIVRGGQVQSVNVTVGERK